MDQSLQSLRYQRGSLSVLDQLLLPHRLEYEPVAGSQDAWRVIRSMQVRGAPLIAIVAALGLAVEVLLPLLSLLLSFNHSHSLTGTRTAGSPRLQGRGR